MTILLQLLFGLFALIYIFYRVFRLFKKYKKKGKSQEIGNRDISSEVENPQMHEAQERSNIKEASGTKYYAKKFSKKLLIYVANFIAFFGILSLVAFCIENFGEKSPGEDAVDKQLEMFKDLQGSWSTTFINKERMKQATPEELELYSFEGKEKFTFKGAETKRIDHGIQQEGDFVVEYIPMDINAVGYKSEGKYKVKEMWEIGRRWITKHKGSYLQHYRNYRKEIELIYNTEIADTADGKFARVVKFQPIVKGNVTPQEIEESMWGFRRNRVIEDNEAEKDGSYIECFNFKMDGDVIYIGDYKYKRE